MTFLKKVRHYSIFIAAFIATLVLVQWSGSLFAQPITYTVDSLTSLNQAIEAVGKLSNGTAVNIEINSPLKLDGEILELHVPNGVEVNISGTGTIDGDGNYRGFVIETAGMGSKVEISGITFQNCAAVGGDGGDGQVGGGGGAGLGAAIYVRGDHGDVTVTDVTFKNNSTVGGDGGSVIDGSMTAGGGGGLGGDGGGGTSDENVYGAGGGGGFGVNATGGSSDAAGLDGGDGIAKTQTDGSGDGYSNTGASQAGDGGINNGGGGGAYGASNNYAAGGGGGELGEDATKDGTTKILTGGEGGYGGGGGGSSEYGGNAGTGGGGGGGNLVGGDGGFGGGGGGSLNTNKTGDGGYGAGDGGTGGGGGLGAGGDIYVEGGATLTVNYTGAYAQSTTKLFGTSTSEGGTGGTGAGDGDALGAIFLNGNSIAFDASGTGGIAITGDINDISATSGFDKWNNDGSSIYYDVKTYGGGVIIKGTDAVTLKGDNIYAGVTKIESGATLIADGAALVDDNGKNITDAKGKTIHNAIGDLSEVQVEAGGTLQLAQNETIGFLSGDGNVALNGGKTLTIAGDEDKDQFGLGYNAATGSIVGAFDGQIITDGAANTTEHLVKIGTGRLTFSGDNTNAGDEFLTTIYQGTVVLGDAKGLGGGAVTVKNIDTGTGTKLRNVLEARADLIGGDAVMNTFHIYKDGKNIDEVQQDFNDFVVGGGHDIQFGQVGVEGGQIIGSGSLLVNMDTKADKVILANDGYDAATSGYLAANLNNYNETKINTGTVVVYENGLGGDTLGRGNVRAVGTPGEAILSAGTDGMTIDNNLVFDETSALTLSNEATGIDYTLSGNTSGKGTMVVNLDDDGDEVTMTGSLKHTGATDIQNGHLIIDPVATNPVTQLYNLSSSATGKLTVTDGDLIANITTDTTYSGTITMTSGTLRKTGSGTWVFDAAGQIIDNINVNAGALQLNQNGNVDIVTLSGNGKLIVNNDVTLDDLFSESLAGNVTIKDNNTLTLTASGTGTLYNTWTGGTGASIEFLSDTILYNAYQYGADWNGTMIVDDGISLTVKSPGGLGNADTAQVTLNNGSTLVVDTYMQNYSSVYKDQINQLNIAGSGTTVNVGTYGNFITGTIDGAGGTEVTKTGNGTWTMLGNSGGTYAGDVNLHQGAIYLQRQGTAASGYTYDANWGAGTLNVTGTNTALAIDVGDTPKTIGSAINLVETLNVFVNDDSAAGGSANLGGAMTGTGGVDYQGNGTLVYDGTAKTYSGPTNVNDGTLRVATGTTLTDYFVNNGGTLELAGVDIGSGGVTVNSGGTLTGTGATTTGDMTFSNGSLLVADYSGGTDPTYSAADVTIANGAVAHIAGTGGGTLTTPLITSSGTQSGMFWFTDDIQGKRAVGEWDNGNLDITFKDVVYMDNAYTTDARNVASYLNAIADNSVNGQVWGLNHTIPVNTLTAGLLNGLENLLPHQYDYALLEIGGQINPSLATAQVQTTTNMFQSITRQLYPVEYFARECHGLRPHGTTAYLGQSVRSGWTGWANGLGVFGDTSGHGNRGTFGYDFETYGTSIGIEPTSAMSVNRLGMFYAYNYTKIDTNKTIGSGHVSSNFFGAYGRFIDSMGYTSFVAGFGFEDYKTHRTVSVSNNSGRSTSDFDGWQGGLYIERGLNHLTLTRYGLQPYVGLQYLYLHTDDFDETGTNPYRLVTDSSHVNSLRTNFGVRIARHVTRVKRGTMHMTANVGWIHEFLDADCMMSSRWAASNNPSTFGVLGNSLGRDWAVLGIGADWSLRHNLNVFGSYDLQINDYQTLNVANVGAKILW